MQTFSILHCVPPILSPSPGSSLWEWIDALCATERTLERATRDRGLPSWTDRSSPKTSTILLRTWIRPKKQGGGVGAMSSSSRGGSSSSPLSSAEIDALLPGRRFLAVETPKSSSTSAKSWKSQKPKDWRWRSGFIRATSSRDTTLANFEVSTVSFCVWPYVVCSCWWRDAIGLLAACTWLFMSRCGSVGLWVGW